MQYVRILLVLLKILYHKKTKTAILLYRNCGLCLASLSGIDSLTRNIKSGIIKSRKATPFFFPVENIVVLVRTRACFQNSLFSPSARSLHPPPAAVAHQARAGFAVASDLSISANEKSTAFAVLFSLAEMERFELSRRLSRPTPLAGAPLRPLEYISVLYLRERPFAELADYIILYFFAFVKMFLRFSCVFIIFICLSPAFERVFLLWNVFIDKIFHL